MARFLSPQRIFSVEWPVSAQRKRSISRSAHPAGNTSPCATTGTDYICRLRLLTRAVPRRNRVDQAVKWRTDGGRGGVRGLSKGTSWRRSCRNPLRWGVSHRCVPSAVRIRPSAASSITKRRAFRRLRRRRQNSRAGEVAGCHRYALLRAGRQIRGGV